MGNTKTNYGIFLSKNDTTFRIPVNPEEWTMDRGGDNNETEVLNIGQIVMPRTPELATIEWESWFPSESTEPYVLTSGGFRDAKFYIDTINRWWNEKEPIRFIVNRELEDGTPLFNTNMQVVIESFEVEEVGGETGDFYYSIELKEFRSYEPATVTIIDTPSDVVQKNQADAVVEPRRQISNDQLCVGDLVIVNGRYWYDSYGSNPYGNANNLSTTIFKIVQSPKAGQKFPINVARIGWVSRDQIQKVRSQ